MKLQFCFWGPPEGPLFLGVIILTGRRTMMDRLLKIIHIKSVQTFKALSRSVYIYMHREIWNYNKKYFVFLDGENM
jgi:hypothetical protein